MSKVTSSQNWSDEDLEYLYKARSESVPYDVIGRELNRTAEACKSKWLKTELDKMSFFSSSDTRVKKSKIVAFEEKMNKTVENKLEMFRLRADVLGDRIESAIKKAPKIKLTPWSPKNKKSKIDSEDIGLVMSDLHIGHSHSLEETGGLSEYNLDIFINRLRNLETSVADIYELHTSLYRIPKLHIFCLGDIVDLNAGFLRSIKKSEHENRLKLRTISKENRADLMAHKLMLGQIRGGTRSVSRLFIEKPVYDDVVCDNAESRLKDGIITVVKGNITYISIREPDVNKLVYRSTRLIREGLLYRLTIL